MTEQRSPLASNPISHEPQRPNQGVLRFLPLLAIGLLAITLFSTGALQHLDPESALARAGSLLDWAQAHPVTGFLLSAAAVAALTACGLPGAAPVFLVSGFLLGPLTAVFAAAVGNVIGTSTLYLALRLALFHRPPSAQAPRLLAAFRERPFLHALLLRAIPIVPNGAATAVLAALRCPWPSFIAASALGHLPNAGLLAWIGAQAAIDLQAGRPLNTEMLADPRWWLPVALLVALAALSLLLRRRSRRLSETEPAATAPADDNAGSVNKLSPERAERTPGTIAN